MNGPPAAEARSKASIRDNKFPPTTGGFNCNEDEVETPDGPNGDEKGLEGCNPRKHQSKNHVNGFLDE